MGNGLWLAPYTYHYDSPNKKYCIVPTGIAHMVTAPELPVSNVYSVCGKFLFSAQVMPAKWSTGVQTERCAKCKRYEILLELAE